METDHHHHNHPVSPDNLNRAFIAGIVLNASFTAIEFMAGFANNSLALISDASHNLSDVGSLLLSLIGFKLAQKAATEKYTYGYKKATILVSLINAIILMVIVGGILREAIIRFRQPMEEKGITIMLIAGIGFVINAISAYLFYDKQNRDINARGAFLHLLLDALVSIGVVVSGLIMYFTGWMWFDPVISVVIAISIVISTWGLLRESLRLSIDAVPRDIDYDTIKKIMLSQEGVTGVHHIHIWALSSNINALTAHVKVNAADNTAANHIRENIRNILLENKIQHITLELEMGENACSDGRC